MAAYDPEAQLPASRPGQRHADPVEKSLARSDEERRRQMAESAAELEATLQSGETGKPAESAGADGSAPPGSIDRSSGA